MLLVIEMLTYSVEVPSHCEDNYNGTSSNRDNKRHRCFYVPRRTWRSLMTLPTLRVTLSWNEKSD